MTERRPGAGQSRRRASRGWHPETIVSAYMLPGENRVLEETRSVRGFLMGQIGWIALTLVVAFGLVGMGGMDLVGPAIVLIVAVAIVIGYRAVQAWFTRYVVTDLRVLRVHGVLNRHSEFIPWGKVTDVTRTESFFQWLAHTATIRIESANESSGFRSIDDVDDPGRFYWVLVEMVDRKQGRIADSSLPRWYS